MRFAMIALAASMAYGQTTKVFHFTQSQDRQQIDEIATVLRLTADIQPESIDYITSSITVNATDAQIAVAAWLTHQLDLPTNGQFTGVYEYRPSSASEDVVRMFYVNHASTPQDLQYIANAVHGIEPVPRISVYNALHAIVMRGTNRQISMDAWLIDQLNQPAHVAAPSPHQYKIADDDVVRVFALANTETREQLQEIVTLIRSVADLGRIYSCEEQRAVALRGPADRVGLAAWLVSKLDQPLSGDAAIPNSTTPREYLLPNDPENVVRVFSLAGDLSPEERQKIAARVRAKAGTARMGLYNSLGALAVRGTAVQVAVAEKVLEEMKVQ
jgi:hypothetical protein